MKVKCRDYIGYLMEIETFCMNGLGKPVSYRVQIRTERGDFIDLRNVKLDEIEFIKEEKQ